jgi:hypothetical protein
MPGDSPFLHEWRTASDLITTSANSLNRLAHLGPRKRELAVFLRTSAQNYSERNRGDYGEATFPISHLAPCSVVS